MIALRLSVIINFHREGILAHASLRAYGIAREYARAEGIDVEFVLVLDRPDDFTRGLVAHHPIIDGSEVIVEADVGDLPLARNAGVVNATGEIISIIDGDDLISRGYFVEHLRQLTQLGRKHILHPEIVVSFGMYNAFNWQLDQCSEYYDKGVMLTVNPWVSAVFAYREVFESIPYVACHPSKTGFGYEDWYWNCETMSRGYTHRLAWGTAYFYRRKWSGSLNEAAHGVRAVMPKAGLFDQRTSSMEQAS